MQQPDCALPIAYDPYRPTGSAKAFIGPARHKLRISRLKFESERAAILTGLASERTYSSYGTGPMRMSGWPDYNLSRP